MKLQSSGDRHKSLQTGLEAIAVASSTSDWSGTPNQTTCSWLVARIQILSHVHALRLMGQL